MPYIKKEERPYYSVLVEVLMSLRTPGQLNYIFTCLAKAYIENNKESYQTYNDIFGALTCCQMELYRRRVAYYENKKIAENGDVF